MGALSVKEIETLIYPVSFYRTKARHVRACCQLLVERFGGRVPQTLDELVTLPGVGRKTANLVMILGFKSRRNICVDTHVHRISNRLGWVSTRGPTKRNRPCTRAIGRRWWPHINLYLVTWGQNVCRPIGPRCGDCVIAEDCPRIGVSRREEMNMRHLMIALVSVVLSAAPVVAQTTPARREAPTAPAAQKSPGAGQVFVVETMKGTIRDSRRIRTKRRKRSSTSSRS